MKNNFVFQKKVFFSLSCVFGLLLSGNSLASTYYSSYGATRINNVSVEIGSYKFEVDGIAQYRNTEWYVNGEYKRTDNSGFFAIDPSYTLTVSENIKIEALVYDGSQYEEKHTWNVTIKKPDLIVYDIKISPTSPVAGEEVTITATLKNQGDADADGSIELEYYIDGNYIGKDDLSFGLNAGNTNDETISTTVTTSGNHLIEVVIDTGNDVDESDESNNTRGETFTWSEPPMPDLIVYDIKISPTSPVAGEEVTITATLKNQGDADADGSIELEYYIDGNYIGKDNLSLGLDSGHTNDESIDITIETSGNHLVEVVIDTDDDVEESDEDNNTRGETFTWSEPPMPDLIVSDIKISPTSPVAGEEVTITATLKNQGDADADGSIALEYYIDGKYIGKDNLSLGLDEGHINDESIDITIETSGNHLVEVVIDTDDDVEESDEDNNTRSETFTWSEPPMPDLIVSDIKISPISPMASEDFTITATLKNQGDANVDVSIELKYYIDDNYIGKDDLSFGLNAGNTNDETITTSITTSGDHKIKVVIDTESIVNESNEDNNLLEKTFTIIEPSSIKGQLIIPSNISMDFTSLKIRVVLNNQFDEVYDDVFNNDGTFFINLVKLEKLYKQNKENDKDFVLFAIEGFEILDQNNNILGHVEYRVNRLTSDDVNDYVNFFRNAEIDEQRSVFHYVFLHLDKMNGNDIRNHLVNNGYPEAEDWDYYEDTEYPVSVLQTYRALNSLEEINIDNNIVLFVHGLNGTIGYWQTGSTNLDSYPGYFEDLSGYDAWEFYYPKNQQISESAQLLSKAVIWLRKKYNNQNIRIISHSMGGLVSRYFIQKLDGAGYVNKLLMLGTPNFGSYNAYVAITIGFDEIIDIFVGDPNSPAYFDLAIGSPFLNELNDPKVELPSLNNNQIDESYLVLAGINNDNIFTFTEIGTINSQRGLGPQDNVVGVTSASLLSHGVPLLLKDISHNLLRNPPVSNREFITNPHSDFDYFSEIITILHKFLLNNYSLNEVVDFAEGGYSSDDNIPNTLIGYDLQRGSFVYPVETSHGTLRLFFEGNPITEFTNGDDLIMHPSESGCFYWSQYFGIGLVPGEYTIRNSSNEIIKEVTILPLRTTYAKDVETGIEVNRTEIRKYELFRNYPNPFNPLTKIKFDLPKASNVSLKIYNLLGQEIKSLVSTFLEQGTHEYIWNGRNKAGNEVASGVYFYELKTNDYRKVYPMLLNVAVQNILDKKWH